MTWSGTASKMQQVKGRALRVSDLVEVIARRPLAFEPGGRFCTASPDVLGVLVETLCGKPLGECLRDMLFSPLAWNTAFSGCRSGLSPTAPKAMLQARLLKEPGMDQFFWITRCLKAGAGAL